MSAFRLALRVEGNFWNAYVARTSSMDGAILIGSIVMTAIRENPERKALFMELMKGIVEEALTVGGVVVEGWSAPMGAPESERGGTG